MKDGLEALNAITDTVLKYGPSKRALEAKPPKPAKPEVKAKPRPGSRRQAAS